MRNKIIIVVILLAILGGLGTYVYKYANSGSRNCGVKYEEDYNNMNNAVYKELDQESAKKNLDENKDIVLIDVRTEEEYKSGHIKNSILIPLDDLENGIKNIYKEKTIYLYCRSGRRSKEASNILLKLGYKNVYNIGGILDWKYEIEK